MKNKKIRLDKLISQNNLLPEKLILPYIMEGSIFVGGQKAMSRAQLVDEDIAIEIINTTKKYVGRGGFKLEAALDTFKVNIENKICVDFGACTGGFTDVLLQKGAKKVYSVETGKHLLADKLRNNEKVINMEDTSIFNIQGFSESIDLSVIDLSFIPLSHALTHIKEITQNAPIIALLKPHYEAQDESLLRKGIVKDAETRNLIIEKFQLWLSENGFQTHGYIESPIKGGGGNTEFLFYLICI